jgi:uncharacterized membrane protein YcaP (DUF421 family)
MDAILRGLIIYVFLLVIFRLSGKRTMAEMTTFDFVVLLIISETVQNALIRQDGSITTAVLLVVTLAGADILLAWLKQRVPAIEKLVDSVPLVIVENGVPLMDRMDKARVDLDDILSAARERRGLERLEQIKYAVLERDGNISIIPSVGAPNAG